MKKIINGNLRKLSIRLVEERVFNRRLYFLLLSIKDMIFRLENYRKDRSEYLKLYNRIIRKINIIIEEYDSVYNKGIGKFSVDLKRVNEKYNDGGK